MWTPRTRAPPTKDSPALRTGPRAERIDMSAVPATMHAAGNRMISSSEERRVIIASSVGTVFEWYDFYLYAILAPFFAALFFPPGNQTAALLGAFGAYAAGFLVRPFGALIFGRIGDLVGRKYTFLVTIVVMGLSTVFVGMLPTYQTIGYAAPLILVALRLAQGLALGGEYGGAATYVAEHAPDRRRGYATSWIQTTATVGMLMALVVILICRLTMAPATFSSWGWRIAFWLSIPLLAISIYIRLKLQESPIFLRLKSQGKRSPHPIKDSFFKYPNNKYVGLALLGATAGQGVVWYTGQFYALFFLLIYLKLDFVSTYILIGLSLVAYQKSTPITVAATDCNFHIFIGPWSRQTACDKAKDFLGKAGLSFESIAAISGEDVVTKFGGIELHGWDQKKYEAALKTTGYPPKADTKQVNWVMAELILVLMVIYVTMVYGPIAAFLVELFPAKIRYTSMSLPYHIGNGWFGGMLPLLATAIVAKAGNIYAGLWYPIIVAIMTFLIGGVFVHETKDVKIHAEV